jgi:hypothetical protein
MTFLKHPPLPALICNALWFCSLRSNLDIEYLFQGLKRLGMIYIDIIPIRLSILFVVGLAMFLLSVNLVMY